MDEHGKLSGTGFFIDPTGTLLTAFSVGADAHDYTIEFDGKELAAYPVMADRRSGIAMLKVDVASPTLPVGKSGELEVTTPVLTVGFPLDLPKTPSFGMIAGFDRKFLGRYFSTTHLRVNLPTQRGEAGAPLLNMKGEVVGILVSSIDNGSACYALPIEAAEKIRSDFVRFGEARHGWVGINVAEAPKEVEGSRAQFTEILPGTPAADSGAEPGDILLEVGKKKVRQPEDVIDASFFITAGDKVPITVMRGDEKLTLEVEAGFHPATQRPPVIASPLAMPTGLDRTP
jgi:serine protease Do